MPASSADFVMLSSRSSPFGSDRHCRARAGVTPKLVADPAGTDVALDERLVPGLLEMTAVRAGERAIFDQLHFRDRVPHPEAAFGSRDDRARPVAAWRRLGSARGNGHQTERDGD